MRKTKYKIIKTKNNDILEYGLEIKNSQNKLCIEQISTKISTVKEIIKKLKPYNVEPEIVLELIPDLLD